MYELQARGRLMGFELGIDVWHGPDLGLAEIKDGDVFSK